MMIYVIDSSAWIEYLAGTDLGEQVRALFRSKRHKFYTTSISLAEVVIKVLRQNMPVEVALNAMTNLSKVIEIDFELGKTAGMLYFRERKKRPKFALADAFVLVAARKLKAKVITKDFDFKGFPETVLLR